VRIQRSIDAAESPEMLAPNLKRKRNPE